MPKNDSLKIGFILDTSLDPNDGVQQYVIALGEWMRQAGHDVHYLVGETKSRQLPNIHSLSKNIQVVFNGNRTTIPLPPNTKRLREFITTQKFDVLHVQTPHHPLLAQTLLRAADERTAVIATFHILPYGGMARYGTKLLGYALRSSLKRVDSMLAVSPAAAAFTRWAYGMSAQVMPNVIDYRRFTAAAPLTKYRSNGKTILFFGRLVPRKGCDLLLQAVMLLKDDDSLPNFHVVVCGKGPQMELLQQYTQEHGLTDTVSFEGFIEETMKPRYYASADISVFPSTGGESFGIVLLEAMASGNSAVLAGDNPGYRSVMHEREDLLFNPTSAKALAEKLRHFLLQEDDRMAAAHWGKQYTEAFDTAKVGADIVAIYRKALRKRRQR